MLKVFPVILILISKQQDFYRASLVLSCFSKLWLRDITAVTLCQFQSSAPLCQILSVLNVSVSVVVLSQNTVGVFLWLQTDTTTVQSASQTPVIYSRVRCVKYAHPPGPTTFAKPNLMILLCVSAVFIKHSHHFSLNTIKWKCNQTHKLQSN